MSVALLHGLCSCPPSIRAFAQERELAHKLDSLFAKGLYNVALNVAQADQVRSHHALRSFCCAARRLLANMTATLLCGDTLLLRCYAAVLSYTRASARR